MVNQKCITTTKLCRDILKIPKEELLALLADRQSYYVPFEKKKITAGGRVKIRTIEPPHGYLKRVLKKINTTVLQPQMERLPYGVMGGRKGYSVVDNAKYHASSPALMKYDIKDFFPSIKYVDVFHIFRYQLNYCEEAANILAHLTTFENSRHGVHVPQGSPTSMSIAIFAVEKMSCVVDDYCRKNGLKFSIWVDDITISGPYDRLCRHRSTINHMLNSTHYRINPDKHSGIVRKGQKGRSVTGVIISNDGRLTVGHSKLSRLRRQVKHSTRPSDKLRGRLQFLLQVNKSQARRLMHEYTEKHRKN